MLVETVKANKFKALFMLANDFIQALLEGIVLGLTYNLLTVLQTGNLSLVGQEWLKWLLVDSFTLSAKMLITWLLVLISLGVFIQSILKYFSRIAGLQLAALIKENIVMVVGQLVKSADYLRLQSMRTGNVITVCLESPEAIRQQFELYANIIISIMYLIVYVFVLAVYSLNEFIFSALCISLIGFAQIYFSFNTKKWALILANNISNVNNTLGDLVRGFKFLKSSSSMHVILDKLEVEAEQVKKSYIKMGLFSEMSAPLGKALGMISIGFISLMFIYSSNDLVGILPRIAIFIVALQRLIGKANEIFSLVKDFASNRGRLMLYNKFVANFSLDNQLKNHIYSQELDNTSHDGNAIEDNEPPEYFTFNQVCFRYPSAEHDSLYNINTSFKSGDFIGVAGQSGSGKSTFIDLITGLVVPSSGSICVNNIPRDLFPQVKLNLANNLFLVDQQNFICHGTIKENIIWSSYLADHGKVWDCLRTVNLEDYVKALPLGLNTLVGEGGLSMSGGQSQRLCIARALYQENQVLILDEATSSLDKENEREILERIKNRYNSKIVIMITHNINNLRFATKCLYFQSGRITASGNCQTVLSHINKHRLENS